jgi:hypothetical protein
MAMSNEDKSLLYKDLCARLPYGVILQVTLKDKYDEVVTRDIRLTSGNISYLEQTSGHWFEYKPYLRPMKSMTAEEQHETIGFNRTLDLGPIKNWVNYTITNPEFVDWLIKHHFDWRNFIGMGLALPATKDMYKNF